MAVLLSCAEEHFLHRIPAELVANRFCSICDQPGRLVVDLGKECHVHYYRCDPCDHVWSHSELIPVAPAVSVTPTPEVPREKQSTDTRTIMTPRARRPRIP